VRNGRHNITVAVGLAVVADDTVARAVELQHGDVVPARGTVCLDGSAERHDSAGILSTTRDASVKGSRVCSKGRDGVTERIVASKHVDKAATVTETRGQDPSRVNTECGREVLDEPRNETLVVNVVLGTPRAPCRIGLKAIKIPVDVSDDTVRIDGGVVEPGLALDVDGSLSISRESQNQR
jgi:hypothetical protein